MESPIHSPPPFCAATAFVTALSSPRQCKLPGLLLSHVCALSPPSTTRAGISQQRAWLAPHMQAGSSTKKRTRTLSPTIINRQARFRYALSDMYECGIELLGSEIKSIRHGSLNLRDGYARVKGGQLYLHNVNIAQWQGAHKTCNHEPLRVRRLLLHKKDIRKLEARQADSGTTLIPTRAYFSEGGYLKIEVAVARGKTLEDKRETIKKRQDERDMRRIVKTAMSR